MQDELSDLNPEWAEYAQNVLEKGIEPKSNPDGQLSNPSSFPLEAFPQAMSTFKTNHMTRSCFRIAMHVEKALSSQTCRHSAHSALP